MTHPAIQTDAPLCGLELVSREAAWRGLEGLLFRLLTPPGQGLVMMEAAKQAPDMMARAEAVAKAGGLAVLMDATFAWKADVAGVLVRVVARHWADCENHRDRLRLAVHEAVVNAVLHGCLGIDPDLRDAAESPDASSNWVAYTHRVREALDDPARGGLPVLLTLEATPQSWTLRIEDTGSGFTPPDPSQAPLPNPGFVATRGRGLLLIRAASDSVAWEREGRTCVLTFTRPAGERAAQ